MAKAQAPLSPHLQIYRWQLTMVTSITHRATGVFLAAGALVLCYWALSVAAGPEQYRQLMECLSGVPGRVFLALVTLSFYYHLCNGIRHLLWDAVIGLDLRTSYLSGWAVIIAALVLTAITWVAAS
jgi:succinate dehydrogenase / fumarate reductase cytochrome b subunit